MWFNDITFEFYSNHKNENLKKKEQKKDTGNS